MKEKLIIKNFGPIKSVELELGRFNVLIGESGTGKSTVAKVLNVLNWYVAELFLTKPTEIRAADFLTIASLIKRLDVHKIGNYFGEDSIIRYFIDEICVFEVANDRISPEFFESDYTLTLMEYWDFIQWQYIPAERAASSLFHAATWTDLLVINAGKIDIPTYFLEFYSLQDKAKRAREEYDFSNTLDIKYQYANGKEHVLRNGQKYKLAETSSAIQTNVSLLAVVDWQFSEEFENGSKIIIEEPELNLFPTTQKKVIEFLIERLKTKNCVFLTTHSPYTLTTLNNMMYAFELGQTNENEVVNVMPKKYWLNPSEVSAYRMLDNGTCEDIMDHDENGALIKAEEIDGVSRILNEEFDKLININIESHK